MSGASDRANGRVSGPVHTSEFSVDLAHSAMALTTLMLTTKMRMLMTTPYKYKHLQKQQQMIFSYHPRLCIPVYLWRTRFFVQKRYWRNRPCAGTAIDTFHSTPGRTPDTRDLFTLRSRTSKYPDVSTRPFTRPFALLLAPLTTLLLTAHFALLIHSLARSLTPESMGK